MKCWEYKKCGREEGGSRAAELGVCPAYPHSGNSCARTVGTHCGSCIEGVYAEKLGNCMLCDFYNSPHYHHSLSNEFAATLIPQTLIKLA